jgi:hypothetical protein
MITGRRILVHVLIVAVAFVTGWAVRRLVVAGKPTSASTERPTSGVVASQSSAPSNDKFSPVAARGLADLAADEFQQLIDLWGANFNSMHPLQSQAGSLLELLRAARTNEDFAKLIDVLNALPGHREASDHLLLPVVDIVFRRWAAIDPHAASLAAARLANRGQQHDALRTVVAAWTQKEGIATLEKLRALPNGLARVYGPDLVFDQLAKDNPEQALELARESGNKDIANGKFRTIFQNWLERDSDAAISWMQRTIGVEESARRVELIAAISVLGWHDPRRAWELVTQLPPESGVRRSTQNDVLSKWMNDDPDGAVAAVLSIPNASDRGELIRNLGMNSTLRNPSPAEAVLAKLSDPADRQHFQSGLATGIVRSGADADFPRAAQIASELPPGESRTALLRELGTYWGRGDAPAASQWLTQQPPGAERDTIIGEFVRSVFPQDPVAAVTWSATISDPGKRERRLNELLPKWIANDPAAAVAWLHEAPSLSTDERAKWLGRAQGEIRN